MDPALKITATKFRPHPAAFVILPLNHPRAASSYI
jgi:hypothetical protein